MNAEDLITESIPPLRTADSVDVALKWLEEFKVRMLPVTDSSIYKGMFSEDLFLDYEGEPEPTVGAYPLMHPQDFIYRHQHILEAIKLSIERDMSIVPVIDEQGKYLGLVNLNEPQLVFDKVTSAMQLGGIIEIKMHEKDYSMAHLSRLIEADDVKILSSVIHTDVAEPENVILTMKLNKSDLARIIATLERFGYNIIAKHHQSELKGNEQDRLGLLLKFLDL